MLIERWWTIRNNMTNEETDQKDNQIVRNQEKPIANLIPD